MPGAPISAVLPLEVSARPRPKKPSPISPVAVSFACWVHFSDDRVNTHAAPAFFSKKVSFSLTVALPVPSTGSDSSTSVSLFTFSTSVKGEILAPFTSKPLKRFLVEGSPLTTFDFSVTSASGSVAIRTLLAPPISDVLPSPDASATLTPNWPWVPLATLPLSFGSVCFSHSDLALRR